MLQAMLASLTEEFKTEVNVVEFCRQAEIVIIMVEEPGAIEDTFDVQWETEQALPWDAMMIGWDEANQVDPTFGYFNRSNMVFIVEVPAYDPIWQVL